MTEDLPTVHVVAAVIVSEDRVLACRRNRDRADGGLWEFPGGKIEPGERAGDALAREIVEELGVRIEVGVRIHRATTRVPKQLIDLDTYCAWLAGDPPLGSTDHDVLRWLMPGELPALEWCAPDAPVVELLAASARASDEFDRLTASSRTPRLGHPEHNVVP